MAGLFIRERMFRVGRHLPLVVVSPRPWFPLQSLIRFFKPGYRPDGAEFERQQEFDVYLPRFLALPGIGRRFDGMMMAVGCIQAKRCHTDTCPVGVATQSARRQRALDVDDKADRARRYQEGTVAEAVKLMAAMGVADPADLEATMLRRNVSVSEHRSYAELFEWLEPGELLAEPPEDWAADWALASADTFHPEWRAAGRRTSRRSA